MVYLFLIFSHNELKTITLREDSAVQTLAIAVQHSPQGVTCLGLGRTPPITAARNIAECTIADTVSTWKSIKTGTVVFC